MFGEVCHIIGSKFVNPFLVKVNFVLFGGIIDILDVIGCKPGDKCSDQMLQCGDQTLHFHDGKIVVDLLHAGCILWRNAVLLHDAVDDSRSCRFGTERHEAKHIGMLLVCNCDNQIVKAQNTF